MTIAHPVRSLSDYPTPHLISVYGAGPGRLRHLLGGLSLDELRARPRPGKWSSLEIALHLVDSERAGLWRIRLAFAQPGSPLHPFQQETWARVFAYQERSLADLEQALALFDSLRVAGLAVFSRASDEQWKTAGGVHGERGPLTLRNLLEIYAEHGERHIEQIVTLRGLIGRTIALPALLWSV
jgi:hypothetical protein